MHNSLVAMREIVMERRLSEKGIIPLQLMTIKTLCYSAALHGKAHGFMET